MINACTMTRRIPACAMLLVAIMLSSLGPRALRAQEASDKALGENLFPPELVMQNQQKLGLKPEQRTRCGAGHTGHRRMSWSSGCSTSRFFVNLFDFCYSLVVIPAVEQQDVAMLDGGYQGIMILRPIAIRGQQNAERF